MFVTIFYIYNNENNTIENNVIEDKKIVILDRCSGCGKCMMIDSEHFKSNQRSEVVSQENLNSKNLSAAISMCRDRAILLN